MKNNDDLQKYLIGAAAMAAGGLVFARRLFNWQFDKAVGRIMIDPYHENLWEFVSASMRVGVQNIAETNLRAQEGKVIQRPLGSPKKFPRMDELMFRTVQLKSLPENESVPLNLTTIIGPQAARPLELTMPIMISGMAGGLALSKKIKIALAKGSALAGTSTNTGEGPFYQAERDAAKKLVVQYTKYLWYKEPKYLKQADAIEMHFGQGATGGIGHTVKNKKMLKILAKEMPLPSKKAVISTARFPDMDKLDKIPELVEELKRVGGGVPVGAKLAAGHSLEADMDIAIRAGVDFIALCGAEAATHGSPPIIQDDFGVPTLYAISRAGKYLRENGLKNKVSLIAAGGLFKPGDFLKAMALGADAVYIGSMALFAVSHDQVLKSLPFEPPTQVAFADGKEAKKFSVKKGTQAIYKYLMSCAEEMGEGVRALGKRDVHDVGLEDLCALDKDIADVIGVPFAGRPG